MIVVDESYPVGEVKPVFASRDVTVKKGVDAKEFYDLLTEIGRGKFGTVYKCQEKSTGLQLAAKFIPIPKRDDRRNVEREVEIMNSLQHSLIIQLYDAFEYQKMMCVVLELIDGGELFDRVIDDEFILTEKACTVLVRQLCQAMEFVHRNNIIHLDLKPENILCLTREGNRIKIIDFGLARRYDPDKKLQVLFGTPEFVAPEVVNFDRISFGTDMWSVGVICYVLLSGLSPFMGSTDVETMANVTIGKYDFDDEAFSKVSKDALDFVSKLLVKDISVRMTSDECLEHPWLKQCKIKLSNPIPVPGVPTIRHQINSPPIQHINIAEKDPELTTTKENLKNFIERWEGHPNSPYIFDAGSTLILPTHEIDKNGSSGFSSRGCSPSPCESLSSHTELFRNENGVRDDNEMVDEIENDDDSTTENKSRHASKEMFERPNSSTPTNRHNKEYLQSFDRRHSDSNYVVNNHSSSLEKVDLAEEIKKLSDRLMMLSSINDELMDYNQRLNENQKYISVDKKAQDLSAPPPPSLVEKKVEKNLEKKTEKKEKPAQLKNIKNSKLNENNLAKTTPINTLVKKSTKANVLMDSKSLVTNGNDVLPQTKIQSKSPVFSDLSERINKLDETQSFYKKTIKVSNFKTTETTTSSEDSVLSNITRFQRASSVSTNSSGSISPFNSHGSAPWPVTNRRTKFRITQLSRDVPIGSPDSHQTIFLEEAAHTTKDCLLHLLEKYNGKESRSGSSIRRHQSISVGHGMADNLEYHSMNSINAFFKRNAFQQSGSTVKKIQARIESKNSQPSH